MVKGVNRTVIEVNDTGSKIFEKIVFYVSPEYGNLSAKSLKKAAGEVSLGLESYPKSKSLRNRVRLKRRLFFLSASFVLLLITGVLLLYFL
ncbi:MAG: hypothetical protein IKK24_00550 [Clostridia bacterium]|nr:hypothetical protein [Clostridia bacterium]